MVYATGTSVRAGRSEAVAAVRAISELIAPTLGPSGSDVLITSPFGEISTTNDGATIMRSVPIEHPAARIAADIALTQESSVGDGTTTAVVLASKLLDEIEPLVEEIGLRAVLAGLDDAEARIAHLITEASEPIKTGDLTRIVATTLCGKGGESHAPLIAELLEASLVEPDAPVALMSRSGAQMHASQRIDGIVVDRLPTREDMPVNIGDARIMLVSGAIEAKRAEGVQLSTTDEIERFFESEDRASEIIAKDIIASGANVLITRKGVDDSIQYALAQAGVLVIRRIPLDELETIAKATGATIIPQPSAKATLGSAKRVRVDEALLATIIEGTNKPSSTILLRGSTEHVAQELERAAHDAIGVVRSTLRSGHTLPGALVIESLIAHDTTLFKPVAQAFASVARCVLAPAGLETLPPAGKGLDARSGLVIDARAQGIIEPIDVKRAAIASAFEIARVVIRIETIVSLPDPRRAQGFE